MSSYDDEEAAAYREEARLRKEIEDEMSGEAAINREITDNLRMASAYGESYSDEDAARMADRVRFSHSREGKVQAEIARRRSRGNCPS